MDLNTERHQQLRCCFPLHKTHADLVETTVEAGIRTVRCAVGKRCGMARIESEHANVNNFVFFL